MDYPKKKIILKNEEKNSPLTQKTKEKSKKSFLPLDAKKETSTKKAQNENDNPIRKIKLTH